MTFYIGTPVDGYKFFRSQGITASSAVALARAERQAMAEDWRVIWTGDDDCLCREWANDSGPCACTRGAYAGDYPRHHFLPGECECEWVRLEGPEDTHLASLGGICGADNAYRRVVGAELALEVLFPIWTAGALEIARYDALLARAMLTGGGVE